MKKRYLATGILFASLTVSLPLLAADPANPGTPSPKAEAWTDDFEAAKATAAKEGKDLLLDFTGSDWCSWCILLHKEVFDTPEFAAAAPKQFVLVELDFPYSESKLSAAVKAQNKQIQRQFNISTFPTVVLLDAQGRPYAAKSGCPGGGPVPYLALLNDLRQVRDKRDAAWAKAVKARGQEKAALLAQGLAVLDDDLVSRHYQPVLAEIKALDPQDALGLAKKFDFRIKINTLYDNLSFDEAPFKEWVKAVDAFIAAEKPSGKNLQDTLQLKLCALHWSGSIENADLALKILADIVAIDPASNTGREAAHLASQIEAKKKELQAKKATASVTPVQASADTK